MIYGLLTGLAIFAALLTYGAKPDKFIVRHYTERGHFEQLTLYTQPIWYARLVGLCLFLSSTGALIGLLIKGA